MSISSAKLSIRFDNDLVINLTPSINCELLDMVFVISSPFLIILLILLVGTEKTITFSVAFL